MKKIGIFVHPRWQAAQELGQELERRLQGRVEEVWLTSAWDDKTTQARISGTDLLICIGGDGTVLWASRAIIPHSVPILGINMGRLGFLAELGPEEAKAKLGQILEGAGRIEERTMLRAETSGQEYHGLNDAVVARSTVVRPIYIEVAVDGGRLGRYCADAVIVATATGSTGYSLSAGGPILYPQAQELVITPVAAHLTGMRSLVVPPSAAIELRVSTDHKAVLSIDGQVGQPLESGALVRVGRSPYVARFLRLSEPADHFAMLGQRLGWRGIHEGPGANPIQPP